jgi:predicted permease
MNDMFGFVFFIVLLSIALVGFFLVFEALFPTRVEKTRSAAQRMPGRSFMVGTVNFLFFGVIALVLFSISNTTTGLVKAIVFLPALSLAGILLIGLAFGLTGMVQFLGERLFPGQSTWKRTLWSTLALSLGSAVPVAGWFLLLPYVGLTGFGGFILSFFAKPQVNA